MTPQQKQKAVANAMEYKTRDDGSEIYVIKAEEGEVKELLMTIIYDENIGGVQDLNYEIAGVACSAVGYMDFEELKKYDTSEDGGDFASVYTFDRLKYLNANNQEEITDTMKEYSTGNISDACAIWYDNAIKDTMRKLIAYILK